ncbi:MAG: prolyl oligopeptidase family serine peptidase, partial [Chlorobi bacterium]|nr:prolyl oligopeptidase family serine peptidase [Chlorobiota bacterium]
MQGKDFTGYWPHDVFWSDDSKTIYFYWNPEKATSDSIYKINTVNKLVSKAEKSERDDFTDDYSYNLTGIDKVYSKKGDIFLKNIKTGKTIQITKTIDDEYEPQFVLNEKHIFYTKNSNLYKWDRINGTTIQITYFKSGFNNSEENDKPKNEEWLEYDQLKNFNVLSQRHLKKELQEKIREESNANYPKAYYLKGWKIYYLQISPNEQYVYCQMYKPADEKKYTEIPNFVTESGYTKMTSSRPKVGSPLDDYKSMIYDVLNDTVFPVNIDSLPGIYDAVFDTESDDSSLKIRKTIIHDPVWNKNGNMAVVEVRSLDNKDRWICKLNFENGNCSFLERQHDSAWIAGPGINYSYSGGIIGWMPDDESIWFQSEETGFSQLYSLNVFTKQKTALTKGSFEIYYPQLSKDNKYFYFTSNKEDKEIRNLYRLSLKNNKLEKLTNYTGRVDYTLSQDEKYFALLISSANEPWELYLMENKTGSKPVKITTSLTPDFLSYNWRMPEFINFNASDGEKIPARLYKPDAGNKNGAGIIFVHGAGYLQNAHKWWSYYYREYMFHNFLVDHGFTVLDIDYRGSAGYGRDWRTAIYRHMGGKDLTDQVDGAKYLVQKQNIDSSRIGIYGGSYGGFITLMAMFKYPDVFKSGAALRAVTDWAHYNHPYTSDILNTPVTDSVAFYNSSPIYYANGLKGRLLICHGMVDNNVQFQDVVRLAQRLIELGKDNWELAVYPMEGHAFKEPGSWTDEYKRIYKLFNETLLGK